MFKKWLGVAAAIVAALLTVGCFGPNITDLNKRLTSIDLVSKKPPDATYVVDPPDRIRVEFVNEPASSRDVSLRSDGCVTLPYLEDVKVGGLTPIQIREKLEKLYSRYYKDPRILIIVTAHASKHIYVFGETGYRGALPYTGSQTVADIMGQVGGYTNRASPTRARVIRRDIEHREVYRVNLKKLIYEGDYTQDLSLAENDILYVPSNWMAWLGYKLENILFPLNTSLSTVGGTRGLAQTPATF